MSHETLKTTRSDKYDPDESEITVHFKYDAGRPAVMYLSNGDPGYPAEPDEINILKIECNGIDITDSLSTQEYEEIEIKLYEDWQSSDYDDRTDEIYEAYKYGGDEE